MYSGILLSHKKEIWPLLTTGPELEDMMLSERSQMQEDKYCRISLMC